MSSNSLQTSSASQTRSYFVNDCRVTDITGVAVVYGRSTADEIFEANV
jgi:hypothetical protein